MQYVAPELLKSGKVDFFKSDIWSLAVTLFAMEEKCYPYALKEKQFPDNFIIDMENDELKSIFTKCFQMNPQNRPSASDILKEQYFF